MEGQDVKGRSRASSTSSHGREVRCGCQYFQSDSLLPERRAMMMRPSSRNANPVATSRDCDHEYEPIVPILIPRTIGPTTAPVVRISDTDVAPVADSDDSTDVKGRYTPGPFLDDVVLPLDGQLEDNAMEARELGSGDTSDDLELETAQQLQDRLEERFLNTNTLGTESRTDGNVNTKQMDSSVMAEVPLSHNTCGLPQRLRSQVDKLHSRIKGIQRPKFTYPIERKKSPKPRKSERQKSSDKSREHEHESTKVKRSRIDRIRSSLPERPKFSFPDKSKFLPNKSRFHLPERPKINLPNLPKLPSKSSFHLPHLPGRRKTPSLREQQRQHSSESTAGSRRNIFDFSTVPRLFDRKSKEHGEYATSSPKESRAQSSESTTLPRTKKAKTSFGSRWTARFTDIKLPDETEVEKPWIHPSLEKPRRSLPAQESIEDAPPIAWIDEHRTDLHSDGPPYDLQDNQSKQVTLPSISKIIHGDANEPYNNTEAPQIDPRMYGDQDIGRLEQEELLREAYKVSFRAVDPHDARHKFLSPDGKDVENEIGIEDDARDPEDERYSTEPEEEEEDEEESAPSDREQQPSSGSSYERRRRGVIEEIDSDEIFVRARGISQDDMSVAKYLTAEIKEALRNPGNALADEVIVLDSPPRPPPRRPARKRNLRKRKEESSESIENITPNEPKQTLRRSKESDYGSNILDNSDSLSGSHHRIVYHAESAPMDLNYVEPLDDIIVVKPLRRKSRCSLRSSSFVPSEPIPDVSPEVSPPPVPQRRKRRTRVITPQINGVESCNGHTPSVLESWRMEVTRPQSEPPVKPARMPSKEAVNIITHIEDDYIEPESQLEADSAPIPPKRRPRSRGTSIFQDNDSRISQGTESLDVAYIDDDEDDMQRLPSDNEDQHQEDFPGYAVIDKREKPPRPPLPRRNRDKFATTPRRSSEPQRPQRAYSTLRSRSYDHPDDYQMTPYDEIEQEEINMLDIDGQHLRELMSGQVVMKMAGRPLPAPPRPIRTKGKDKIRETEDEIEDLSTYASGTQTDPLPDNMVIEEEIIQARAVITPSLTGSQILVSTERIPTPHPFQITAISHEEIGSLDYDILRGTSTRSEPELLRQRREESPRKSLDVPYIPPLPSQTVSTVYTEEMPPQRPPRTRSTSISVRGDDARISVIEELEERLTALLSSEKLKLANLEVGDLRVEKLSVSTLEAHKIAVSELDAIVVTASEITCGEDEEPVINPSLLRELVAIRNQLEAVVAAPPSPLPPRTPVPMSEDFSADSKIKSTVMQVKESRPESPQCHQLHLDPVSKSMETRALYSSQGVEHVPIREIPQYTDELIKSSSPASSKSTSRASSPIRSPVTGALISRETASPVRSLPPTISVTPDTVEPSLDTENSTESHKKLTTPETKPQRATLSYSAENSPECPEHLDRTSTISPQLIAFQTSQIPAQFFTLASPQVQTPQPTPNSGNDEPSVLDMTQQLLLALRRAGKRAMRHFVSYVVSRVSQEETEAKIREVELTLCALLLIIAGLLIVCFAGPRTITHHHHWDYFNPPRL